MTREKRLVLLLLLLLTVVIWRRARGDEADEKAGAARAIAWAKSFAEASELAAKQKKPLMVDFEAEWCGFCKKLDRETYTDERVIRLVSESFVAVKVDVDKEPDLGKKFNIEGLPTIVFISPGGEELQRISGFRPPELFIKDVQKSSESSSALAKLKELAANDPKDAAAQRAYARALFAAGNVDGAVKVLTAARDQLAEENADKAGVLLDLADALRTRGDRAEARVVYERLLAMKSEAAGESRDKAYLPLANVLVALKESDKAIGLLDRLLGEGKPDSRDRVEALFLRGYAHAVQRDAEKALVDLRAVKEADPNGRWGFRAAQIIDLFETK